MRSMKRRALLSGGAKLRRGKRFPSALPMRARGMHLAWVDLSALGHTSMHGRVSALLSCSPGSMDQDCFFGGSARGLRHVGGVEDFAETSQAS
jgi:hypothetical protein